MVSYVRNILVTLSILLNVIFGGEIHQTFSANNYERYRRSKLNMVRFIDLLFWWDPDHCLKSWVSWITKYNMENMKNGE